MRNTFLRAVGAACAGVSFCHGALAAGELKLPASGATPRELVDAALRTELHGPTAERDALLKQALAQDPDFAPARWQSGFVRWDDQWLTLDQVAKRAGDDKLLAAYRKRRDRMIDTADAHRELAVWCGKHGLQDESRIHWAKVLEFNPRDAEALTALGLELYNGRLLTKEQIAEAKKQAGEQRRATRRWQPQLVKWRNAIARGGKARDEALEALRNLSDPQAIGALEATFAEDGEGKKADQLNLALIETVGRIPFPEATQVLLRRAIVPDSRRVREAACDELKKRPMHAYVPQLITAIPGKLTTRGQLTVTGYTVLLQEEILIQGKETEYYLTREETVTPMPVLFSGHGNATPAQWQASILRALATGLNANLARESQRLAQLEQRTQAYQQWRDSLSDRIELVLERTTGWSDASDARALERQWNDYNGWYKSPFAYPRRISQSAVNVEVVPTVAFASHSCFPAGTPVLTLEGKKPIETIKSGDHVLSQNLETGELGFKTVHARTIRAGLPLVRIACQAEAIRATRNHPFWVAGSGWRVAKFLKPGDRLVTRNGTTCVVGVEEQPGAEVYNLIVDGWHDYFVGESEFLVHDNSPLQETSTLVPGLSALPASP